MRVFRLAAVTRLDLRYEISSDGFDLFCINENNYKYTSMAKICSYIFLFSQWI